MTDRRAHYKSEGASEQEAHVASRVQRRAIVVLDDTGRADRPSDAQQ